MVKSNKNIEDSEIINPNIIKGFDLSLFFVLYRFLDEDLLLSFSLLKRFEKGLFTLKIEFI